MKITGFIFCVLFLSLSGLVNAQSLSCREITTDDGLTSSQIYFCLRDHNGYLWFASDNGVSRYNGFQFKIFKTKDGLADNSNFHITEDRKGRIWCDGMNGGLRYILNDKVYSTPGADSLEKKIRSAKALIQKTHADNTGKIWAATNIGLFWLDEADNFTICHTQIRVPETVTDYIFVTADSVALLSTNYFANSEYTIKNLSDKRVVCIDYFGRRQTVECPVSKTNASASPCGFINEKGELIFNYYNTIYRLNASGFDSLTTIPKSPICMFYSNDHVLWLGTMTSGMYCYRKNDFSKPAAIYLNGISVSGACIDYEGGMWFSTLGKGVLYCPVPSLTDYSKNPLLNQRVTAIGKTNSGLIFSTNNQIISALEMKTDSIRQLNLFKMPISLYDVRQDSSWLYLAGSKTASRVNNQYGGIQFYGMESGIGVFDSLPQSGTYAVTISPSGRRFFISDKFLIELRDTLVKLPKQSKPVLYHVQHRLAELPNRGRSIFCTRNNQILVGCSNVLMEYTDAAGLTLFSGADSSLVGKATAIKEDRDGRLWIATVAKGVVVCDKNKTIQFNELKGQPFDYCTALEIDEEGNVWVGTILGLIKITVNSDNLKMSKVDRFEVSSGLISNEIIRLSVFNGKVWVGTVKGLCTIDIATMQVNSFPPPVYISAIQVDDSLYSRFDSFPELRYDQNNFRFYVEALSYRGKKTLTYLYKLTGYDEKWLESSDPVLIYQNLPAGDYKLIVIAKNNFGFKSASPAVFSFTIPAPFWETWWFRSLILLFTGGLIYLFVRYRLNQIRLREQEKTHTQKLASEFQLTALRSQMNPHFIFNAINSIQSFILQNNAEEAYDYLAKFSKLIRAVLNHSQQRVILLEQEIDMLKLYLQLEELRFTNMFKYRFEIDDAIDESQIYIPSMLIQPYVENAIWHGLMNLRGERDPQLIIRILAAGDLLKIIVEDNGVGREAARKFARDFTHKSLAMELSRQRLELMNQMPEEEKSSVIITDLYDANRNAIGTSIEIIVRYNST